MDIWGKAFQAEVEASAKIDLKEPTRHSASRHTSLLSSMHLPQRQQ